jgi:CheY-like chemotaxis protein
MSLKERPTILVIGNDAALGYLLGRFAERSGYELAVNLDNSSIEQVAAVNPAVIVFPSTEILETFQTLVGELASLDFPIMVCSSVADEAKARELGADYCLLHPLVYDDFQTALASASASKHI